MKKLTVRDVDFAGKRVLVRVDFNVPIEDGKVTDDTRIRAAVPTLKLILEKNPRAVILMSHLGRPKGQRSPEFSLQPAAPALSDALGKDVIFVDETVGDKVKKTIDESPEGSVILVENTRFDAGETKNDPEFAAKLAELGDIFVNDAFGTAHRAHASNVGLSEKMTAVAGLLLEKEIEYLSNTLENPEHPFVAILGGAKVSDKIGVIEALLGKVDKLLIGGGMANTFFKAQGYEMGDSLVENESLDVARELLEKAGDKIKLPVDAVIADEFKNDANRREIKVADGVPDGWAIYDIGSETIQQYNSELDDAKTVVWNGPMGVFEMKNFAPGTFNMATRLSALTEEGATTIVGGGDSVAAVKDSGLTDKITHISTGGGASLELMEGKELPGLTSLTDK